MAPFWRKKQKKMDFLGLFVNVYIFSVKCNTIIFRVEVILRILLNKIYAHLLNKIGAVLSMFVKPRMNRRNQRTRQMNVHHGLITAYKCFRVSRFKVSTLEQINELFAQRRVFIQVDETAVLRSSLILVQDDERLLEVVNFFLFEAFGLVELLFPLILHDLDSGLQLSVSKLRVSIFERQIGRHGRQDEVHFGLHAEIVDILLFEVAI